MCGACPRPDAGRRRSGQLLGVLAETGDPAKLARHPDFGSSAEFPVLFEFINKSLDYFTRR
jgi:hypothetical protein